MGLGCAVQSPCGAMMLYSPIRAASRNSLKNLPCLTIVNLDLSGVGERHGMHTALLGHDDFVSHIAEPRGSHGLEAVSLEISCVQKAEGCATIKIEFDSKCNWHLTHVP